MDNAHEQESLPLASLLGTIDKRQFLITSYFLFSFRWHCTMCSKKWSLKFINIFVYDTIGVYVIVSRVGESSLWPLVTIVSQTSIWKWKRDSSWFTIANLTRQIRLEPTTMTICGVGKCPQHGHIYTSFFSTPINCVDMIRPLLSQI